MRRIFLILAATACGGSPGAPAADVPVVSQEVDPGRVLSLTEELRIDGEREDAAFYVIRSVALDDDGKIYVLDGGNHRVQMFDGTGTLTATFGREGDGPGDLRAPVNLWVAGDTIAIADMPNRLHLFGVGGELLYSRAYEDLSPDEDAWYVRSVTHSSEGWLLATGAYFRSASRGANPLQRLALFRVGERGALGPAGFYYERELTGQMSGMFFVQPPFVANPGTAIDGLGRVHVAESAGYTIDVYDASGSRLYSVENEVERLPVTDELLDDWRQAHACPRGAPECSQPLMDLALSMEIPPYRPAVGFMLAFSLGHVAVFRDDLDPDMSDTIVEGRYDVFDPCGRYLGYFPRGLRPHWFDGRTLLATQSNELSVPSVVRYRVE